MGKTSKGSILVCCRMSQLGLRKLAEMYVTVASVSTEIRTQDLINDAGVSATTSTFGVRLHINIYYQLLLLS
jgi:hypothetical protein